MNINNLINNYKENGYVILKSQFTKEYCDKIKKYVLNLEPKKKIPYSNKAEGFGNLINDNICKEIINNKNINNFLKSFFNNQNYVFNHLYVINKEKFIGSSVEWHQEFYNIDTYAPGYSKDLSKFCQIFIALDNHNLENGCLKIIPKSHELGLLPFVDIVDTNYSHKRKVSYEAMELAYNKYGIKNCILEPGDIIIFNHLLIHSSTSNNSPYSRMAIVSQSRLNYKEKDNEIFRKYSKFRSNFIKNNLNRIIEKTSYNKYNDFKLK